MSLWFAKDYIKKALNRWDIDGQYWAKEAMKQIELAAVEKETEVKHPIDSNGKINRKRNYCYTCGTTVKNQKYCHTCGRKLLWS